MRGGRNAGSAGGTRLGPAVAFLLAAALVGAPTVLLANGGTLRLANVAMGEYRVSVFTDPTPVRPDSLDVSVLVLQEGELGVPEGLDITIRTDLIEVLDEAPTSAPATTMRATRGAADDPRYYAAKFPLGAAGVWRITIELQGDHGEGSASFDLTARERGVLGHPLVLSLLGLLPLAGAAWWIQRSDGDDSPAETEDDPAKG